MYRQPLTHPSLADRTVMRCCFNHADEQRDWESATPKEIPAGYRPYWKWVSGNVLEFGIEPVEDSPALPPPGGDEFDAMTLADLQTLAPRMGVKGAGKMQRGDLIAALRTKKAEKQS